jgi:Skp family chaperone for outer membrane proteins
MRLHGQRMGNGDIIMTISDRRKQELITQFESEQAAAETAHEERKFIEEYARKQTPDRQKVKDDLANAIAP